MRSTSSPSPHRSGRRATIPSGTPPPAPPPPARGAAAWPRAPPPSRCAWWSTQRPRRRRRDRRRASASQTVSRAATTDTPHERYVGRRRAPATVPGRQDARRGTSVRNPGGYRHMTDMIERSDATEGDHVLDHLVVRFAGDSGDGMQLTGDRFTSVSASFGNDLSTMPDFPAEIRAPAGTVNGVSSFQVNIADHDITTPGDEPNVLVAMNPAALMADLHRLEPGGTVIVNEDAFDERNLAKVGYSDEPARRRQPRQLSGVARADDQPHEGGLHPPRREATRCRTVEELLRPRTGVVDVHPTDRRDARLDRRTVRQERTGAGRQPGVVPRRIQLRRDHRGRRPPLRGPSGPAHPPASTRASPATPRWPGASSPPDNSQHCPITLGSYPITPASDILHELSKHKHFGIRTVQAEDEIAAVGHGARCGVRRTSRRHHHERARAWR